jgi:DegV family protein with EDD domain
MAKKIAILTDSSSSIYTVKHNYENIFMMNLPCYLGEEIFSDFDKYGDTLFYAAYRKSKLIPKTSQPSVGESLKMFEEIKALGYTDIIYLPISKELSGTYANGHISKEMIQGINIEVVDTKTTVSILGSITLEAARMAKEGRTVSEILERVYAIRDNSAYYVTVNDLTSLVKNGRLSYAKFRIANLLHIKPVIILNSDGRLVSIENVRTYKSAIRKVIQHVFQHLDPVKGEVHISYTDNVLDMEFAKAEILKINPNVNLKVFTIPSTVAAHLGLDSLGVGYINF